MKKTMIDFFYKHYEEDGEPYADPSAYTDVSRYLRNVQDKDIQELIYLSGLHEVAKAIVFDAIEKRG